VLRHRPELVGVTLDEGGWVDVEELLGALSAHGRPLTRAQLEQLVSGSDKQRFALQGNWIRASQGHSVPVDLGLEPVDPQALLFHGTPERYVDAIRREGLRRGDRHHVHLSADVETATLVGARRGHPRVLSVDAAGMAAAGHVFLRSDNGVWLVDAVPPGFLTLL
jgi:putative RNA 2'-phosphotransferase